jgi:molybdopterin synthase sulfur carrier subunit
MNVELRFFATVREAVGASTLTREFPADTTVGEALATLESAYPDLDGVLLDDGDVAASVTVMRNGVHVDNLDGPTTTLSDGDRLSITPPVTGG